MGVVAGFIKSKIGNVPEDKLKEDLIYYSDLMRSWVEDDNHATYDAGHHP